MEERCFLKAASIGECSGKDREEIRSLLFPLPQGSGFVFGILTIPKASNNDATPIPVIETGLEGWAAMFETEKHLQPQFEQLLASINESCALEVRKGTWSIPLERCSFLIGCVAGQTVALSGTGNRVEALFLHKKPDTLHYHVFNLARSIQTSQVLPSWEKPFALVLDGEMQRGDVLCLASPDLTLTINPEELHPCLTTLPPSSAVSHIRQFFPAATNLGVVVIASQESCVEDDQTLPVEESLRGWQRTQEMTEELLEDEGLNIQKILKHLSFFRRPKTEKRTTNSGTLPAVIGVWNSGVEYIGRAALWVVRRSKGRDPDRRLTSQKVRRDFPVRGFLAWWQHLPKKTRNMTRVALLLAGIVVIGGGYTHVRSNAKAQENAYALHVTEIGTLLERAESTSIYDRVRARSLVNQAQTALGALTSPPASQEQAFSRINERYAEVSQKLRGLVRVENPVLVGTLESADDRLLALFKRNGEWFGASQQRQIYRLDQTKAIFQSTTLRVGEVGEPLAVSQSKETVFIADDRPGLSLYQPKDGSWKPSLAALGKQIADLAVYNERVYLLASQTDGEQTIYRANQSVGDIGTPSPWIRTQTTQLVNAVSLTIDSAVYVLQKDGKVVRFVSGEETPWTLSPLDPPLTQADDILTTAESDYLYILDRSTGRLIVFDKERGDFVRQYEHELLKQANDLEVDETSKTVFFLTDKTLQRFSVNHLDT